MGLRCGKEIHGRIVVLEGMCWWICYMKYPKPDECIGLFGEMKVSGLKPDQATDSNILGAFLRIGNIDAEKLFVEIKEKHKVSWIQMIVDYVQNNLEEDALILFG
ncbi:hypothetical protein POM88_009243 [Heracleum sosnowskyi]|uniref:Pentatricopeptide repeat-containing protein n=1 Tax=Heracleum sosnowskyi TaxID=360622 RepID=A0AAD8J7P6_9APIA|nr:hypothetical protein POM88_009243 [Heracleum sosnowskyi]